MKPLVSVIIPNYNHGAFLRQRIDAVLAQTFVDFELIILDDASSDNSVDIIKSFTDRRITHISCNEKNSGNTFVQWKKGLELAGGELAWIAESDDYCSPNLLEVLVDSMIQLPEVALAYSRTERVDEHGNFLDDLSFWYEGLNTQRWENNYVGNGIEEIKKYLCLKNTVPNASAVLFRRVAALEIIDETSGFRLCGDWLFWIRLLQSGNISYHTECTNYFRVHDKTVRRKEDKHNTSNGEHRQILNYLKKSGFISWLDRWAILKIDPKRNYIPARGRYERILQKIAKRIIQN